MTREGVACREVRRRPGLHRQGGCGRGFQHGAKPRGPCASTWTEARRQRRAGRCLAQMPRSRMAIPSPGWQNFSNSATTELLLGDGRVVTPEVPIVVMATG
jgi:hypothetical protein